MNPSNVTDSENMKSEGVLVLNQPDLYGAGQCWPRKGIW